VTFDARNLSLRVGVALVGIPLILFLVLSGGWRVLALAGVLSVLGAWEWADLCGLRRMKALYALTIIGPLLLLGASIFGGAAGWMAAAIFVLFLAFILAQAGPWKEVGAVRSIGATITGTLYVGFFGLMKPISDGRGSVIAADGGKLVAAALCMVWLGDTLAYFGGSAWGRHRLAPTISPKKSWEGAVFGFVGAVLGAVVAWFLFRPQTLLFGELLGLGAVIGIIGQIGDLAESLVKRDAQKKDSSNILPGHGGVLDRFDSFLFSLPVLWGWIHLRPLW